MPALDQLDVLQNESDAETDIDDRQNNNARTLLFRVANCAVILRNTERFVSVVTISTSLIYGAAHFN